MSDTYDNEKRREDVLRRMLSTPPKPQEVGRHKADQPMAPNGIKDSEGVPPSYPARPHHLEAAGQSA
ncbi:hypothetical protein [Ancylobacter sp. IITR112]|uniref:hypothetical protein n=1 Tax=Ancylobacter sp. IITR112 TaxID=3138073 RepID=UPI00352B8A42